MKVSEILVQAKALIDTPDKWLKEAMARDAEGFTVAHYASSEDFDPVCFCSLGAVVEAQRRLKSCHYPGLDPFDLLLDSLEDGWLSIANFNDNPKTTHQDVMDLFDRAIANCETNEP